MTATNSNPSPIQPVQMDCGDWTVGESLILIQAIYKLGEGPDQWPEIARLLQHHALLDRPELYSPKHCQAHYQLLSSRFQDLVQPGSPLLVQLARYLHAQRVKQVESELAQEEDRFRTLVKEIEDIQSGKWDDRLELSANDDTMDMDVVQETPVEESSSTDMLHTMETTEDVTDTVQEEEEEIETKTTRNTRRTQVESPRTTRKVKTEPKEPQSSPRRKLEKKTSEVTGDSGSETTRKRGRPKSSSFSQQDTTSVVSDAESVATIDSKRRLGTITTEEDRAKVFKKNAMMIWHKLVDHRCGPVFMYPVKKDLAPHYYDVVKKPMCLSAIRTRIREGDIKTAHEFHRDVLLLLTNAIMYNREDADMYSMAMEMKEFAQGEMRNLAYYGDAGQSRRTSISPIETPSLPLEPQDQDTPDTSQEKRSSSRNTRPLRKDDKKRGKQNKL